MRDHVRYLIRRLAHADLDSAFECRLRGLRLEPHAFVSTADEAVARGPGAMDAVLARQDEAHCYFGVLQGSKAPR